MEKGQYGILGVPVLFVCNVCMQTVGGLAGRSGRLRSVEACAKLILYK